MKINLLCELTLTNINYKEKTRPILDYIIICKFCGSTSTTEEGIDVLFTAQID